MSKFDRYLLSQFLIVFGFFALVLVGVYWVNRAVRLFEWLIASGQSAWVFLEFTFLSLPAVIRLALPVASFVAAVYVTNRLSRESELAVMQATGLSPWRMARPVLLFGLILTLAMSVLVHVLIPASRAQLALRSAEIAGNATSGLLVEGTFLHPAPGVTFFVSEITPEGELVSTFLSDRRDPAAETTYTAERAFLVKGEAGPKLVMIDGTAQVLQADSGRLFLTRFADFTYDIGALYNSRVAPAGRPGEFFTTRLLRADAADLAATRSSRAFYLGEAHQRIAQSLWAGFVPLIGFAMLLVGGYSRFGLWQQIGVAITAVVIVQFVSNATAVYTTNTDGGWLAAYLPVAAAAFFAGSGLWMAARGRRPATRVSEAVA